MKVKLVPYLGIDSRYVLNAYKHLLLAILQWYVFSSLDTNSKILDLSGNEYHAQGLLFQLKIGYR